MMSDKDFAAEAIRRGKLIKAKRGHRHSQVMALTALAVCFVFGGVVAAVAALYPDDGLMTASAGRTSILFPRAGGYVLCGILCFMLGAAVTLIALRKRERGLTPTTNQSIKTEEQSLKQKDFNPP